MGEHEATTSGGHNGGGMSSDVAGATLLFARGLGLELEELEAAVGLPPERWLERGARLPDNAAAAVWRLLCQRYPGRALPLEMARAAPFTWFGPLAHGAQFAEHLRAALDTFVRYRAVLSDTLHVALVDTVEGTELRLSHPSDALDGGAGAEAGIALGYRFVGEVIGRTDAVRAVHFAHEPLADPGLYAAFFAVPVHFGSGANAILFDPAAMDLPLAQADPALFAHIERSLAAARAQLAAPDELQGIRDAIADGAAEGDYSTAGLARRCATSLRSLQRRATSHGTTLKALLEEARRAHACALLDDGQLSVDEVAFLLGYADERAFRRAFSRMCGVSPAVWRRTRRR